MTITRRLIAEEIDEDESSIASMDEGIQVSITRSASNLPLHIAVFIPMIFNEVKVITLKKEKGVWKATYNERTYIRVSLHSINDIHIVILEFIKRG